MDCLRGVVFFGRVRQVEAHGKRWARRIAREAVGIEYIESRRPRFLNFVRAHASEFGGLVAGMNLDAARLGRVAEIDPGRGERVGIAHYDHAIERVRHLLEDAVVREGDAALGNIGHAINSDSMLIRLLGVLIAAALAREANLVAQPELNDGDAHGDAPYLVEDGWTALFNGRDLAGWHGL